MTQQRGSNMFFKSIKTHLYRHILNLLFSIAIIILVVVFSADYYERSILKARLNSFTGEFFYPKLNVAIYLAHNGVFPESISQVSNAIPWVTIEDRIWGKTTVRSDIKNGAITFQFEHNVEKSLKGKKITLRPATPINDPMGPVCWVTNKQTTVEGWHLQGVDLTDIPSEYLSTELTLKP